MSVTFDSALKPGPTPGKFNASLNGVPFRLNPDSLSLDFMIKSSTTPTVGGLVVQVFGVEFSDLVVTGSFGAGGWKEQVQFLDRMKLLAYNQSVQPVGAAPPEPFLFLFPSRNYKFNVFLKSYTSPQGMAVVHDNQIINPQWTLTLFIETDLTNGQLTKKTAMDAYIARLSNGLGYKINEFNGPQNTAETVSYINQYGGGLSPSDYITAAFGGPTSPVQATVPVGSGAAAPTTGQPFAPGGKTNHPGLGKNGTWSIFNQGGGDAAAAQWAKDLLTALGAPQTPSNLQFIYDWEVSEGSGGQYNPLNQGPVSTHPELTTSGSQFGGGAANYASYSAGIQGAVIYIGSYSNYTHVKTALLAGDGVTAKQALWTSPWASGHYGFGANWANTPYGQ